MSEQPAFTEEMKRAGMLDGLTAAERRVVLKYLEEEHVADIDWENCLVVDD